MESLRKGDEGLAVTVLQKRLIAKGFKPGKVDGDFGTGTDRAVRQFQAANHLRVDGVVGDRTWALLLAEPAIDVDVALIEGERKRLLAQVALGKSARRSVLETAIGTVGWKERPDGSNGGPEIDVMSTGLPGWDYAKEGKPPWCALAVSWWLLKGLEAPSYEATPLGRRFAAVAQLEDWAKRKKRVARPLASVPAEAGAIFTMSRGESGSDPSTQITAGHTGLIVRDEGEWVVTIEGNTGNCVSSRKRRKSTLRMLIPWW